MFTVSKIFWMFVINQHFFIFVDCGFNLLLSHHRSIGRKLVLSATAFMIFFAVVPIGDWLTERLENRFPSNPTLSPDIAGIIVLGGAINQYITTSRQQPALTSSGERYTEFVYLSRQFPAKLGSFFRWVWLCFGSKYERGGRRKVFFRTRRS